jgi:GNAT superfamily N-acetyltransferase
VIRPARPADLTAIVDALGHAEFFANRIERQRRNQGVLLTAWEADRPVGGVYVWLEPADEPEVREQLPGVPLLNRLEVVAERRNGGIGTRLVSAAERLLAAGGHVRVALAVEKSNSDAERLYKRLGYQDWQLGDVTCYSEETDEDGRPIPEQCMILVKRLRNGTAH